MKLLKMLGVVIPLKIVFRRTSGTFTAILMHILGRCHEYINIQLLRVTSFLCDSKRKISPEKRMRTLKW